MPDETTPEESAREESAHEETVKDAPPRATPRRAGPRGGTLTWGIMLLVVAGAALVSALADPARITPAVALWAIVGIGAALVIVALIAATVRAVGTRAD
ncbi:MAG: hypothetical protein ACOH1T_07890 [Microbacteriaceae bacterium]